MRVSDFNLQFVYFFFFKFRDVYKIVCEMWWRWGKESFERVEVIFYFRLCKCGYFGEIK